MNEEQQKVLAEAMKQEILRKILSKEAKERLGRVRLANPVFATQLEMYLLQLYQMGQIKKTIDDATLKKLLSSLIQKKDRKIKIIKK